MPKPLPEKTCATCGRPFAWRRRWADVWDEVRYCSRTCRGGPGPLDREVEAELGRMLARRPPPATLCPSEVARSVFPDRWRGEMERVRRAGRRLAQRGVLEVTQGGRTVDPGTARGPIRYRSLGRKAGGPGGEPCTGGQGGPGGEPCTSGPPAA